ncbi:hypothetical protein BFP97_05525 [Roseivirga sp. 4D4]|uniref:hypothetical protein n=1 Tax=Roseivirga sp. 4D4 TaxID=1889784 RepID=UPI000853C985|nr:hypothetical protein [Roseivirga sp. 4D4]OEK01003.1 hypothetical protein BFP97_05525 [Roseivirga sp. 4D4]
MKKPRAFFIGLAIVIVAFTIFAIVYRAIYSMDIARSYQVNSPHFETSLFIATQSSPFKDRLVNQLVDSLEKHPLFIQVKDISRLESISPEEWNAILVIHTWEYYKAPNAVRQFASDWKELDHIVYFSTSGDGGYALEDVDAISGASKEDQIENYTVQILDKLRPHILSKPIDQNHIVH